MPEVYELSRSTCEVLLRAGVAGRIAFVASDGPHVVPVNYAVVDAGVLLRTAPYSLLGRCGRDEVVAFEIDLLDHESQRGWSVLVRGRSQVVAPEELDGLEHAWSPHPWAAGVRPLVLRIPMDEVTGRRLGREWDVESSLPVRRAL